MFGWLNGIGITNDDRLLQMSSTHNQVETLNTHNPIAFINNNFYVILFDFALAVYCIVCDYVIFESDGLKTNISWLTGLDMKLISALLDNFSHSLIALLSWLIVRLPHVHANELILSAFIGSIIDIDHFLSARSMRLTDATSLSSRPFLHNSLTLFFLTVLVVFYTSIYSVKHRYFSLLFFLSWFSHHLRDANRHGLWINLIGFNYHTRPLNAGFYISFVCLLPVLSRVIFSRASPAQNMYVYSTVWIFSMIFRSILKKAVLKK